MKYYEDPAVGIRSFEADGSQDFLITPEMRELTLSEVDAHLNPPATYKKALDALNTTYQADIDKLKSASALTLLADGPTEDAKLATIRTQYEACRAKHTADLAALKTQYGV